VESPTSPTSGPVTSESLAGTVTTPLPSDDPAAVSSRSAALESRRSEIAAATPAEFDTQTAAWFDAICKPFADLDPVTFDKDDNDNLSPIESLAYYRAMSESFTATSQAAASLPPPTIQDGAELVSNLTASMSESGTTFGGLVDTASGSATGPAQQTVEILRDASRTYISSGYYPISSLDASVIAALHSLPSCAVAGW
jgi:hypothetical protein